MMKTPPQIITIPNGFAVVKPPIKPGAKPQHLPLKIVFNRDSVTLCGDDVFVHLPAVFNNVSKDIVQKPFGTFERYTQNVAVSFELQIITVQKVWETLIKRNPTKSEQEIDKLPLEEARQIARRLVLQLVEEMPRRDDNKLLSPLKKHDLIRDAMPLRVWMKLPWDDTQELVELAYNRCLEIRAELKRRWLEK